MRSLLSLLYSLIALCFTTLYGYGQDFSAIHYTIDDGLPSNTVYHIYTSTDGYLWIATDKGIARYNGIKFEIFNTSNGLPDNEVFFFNEDKEGRLWLATYNGDLCYYKNDTFHTENNTPFLKLPFKTSFIRQITVEKDSSVNIIFMDSKRFININKQRATVIDLSKLDNEPATGILYRKKLGDNNYKIITVGGVLVIDTLGNVQSINTENYRRHGNEYSVKWGGAFDQDQQYIYNEHYIFSTNMVELKKFNKDFYKKNYLYQVYYNNNWFFTTNNGIVVNDTLRILNNNKVSGITQDKKGNYWASTLENGIYCINKYFMDAKLYKGAYTGKVQYSCCNKNNIFFSTGNELYKINDGAISLAINYNRILPKERKFAFVSGCYMDSSYNYYYCSNAVSLLFKNVMRKQIVLKKIIDNFPLYYTVKELIGLGADIYINCRSKILRVNYANLRPGDKIKYDIVSDSLSNERIFAMAKSPGNAIWYATVNSMYKIDNGYRVAQPQFKNATFKFFYFFNNYLIGYTHNNQLLLCSNINSTNIHIDTLVSQNCIWDKFYAIDSAHLLITTNNFDRLLTLHPAGGGKYSLRIIENPFIPLQPESICCDSNICYFFKNGIVTSVDIKNFFIKSDPPELFFTNLKTSSIAARIQPEMELPLSRARNISISFSTLSFSGKEIFYQYSISKNHQDNWRDISGNINLINTGYGNYTIKMRAKTISSAYCSPVIFTLHILRPYWATWWFAGICIIVAVTIVSAIVRLRIVYVLHQREKEHNREIKFMKSEYKALNALMNPHFIFNTLNNVQSLFNGDDKRAANEYFMIFSDLIRQNMHNISQELITLKKEIDLVNNYLLLEKMRFEERLDYVINIENDLDVSEIMIPPLLIQPLVENSIKHGILPSALLSGTIEINIYERTGIIYIEVRDNGVGIGNQKTRKAASHESYGIENIKKRLSQLSVIQNKEVSFNIIEINESTIEDHWTVVTISMSI